MEFSDFIRTPFKVEAVQITEENIEDICKLIGTEIVQKDGTKYIRIDRRIVPLGTKAELGSWVTKMGEKLRCYPDRIFQQQFTPLTDEWNGWFTEDDDEADVEETLEILNDDETMEAIAEAESEGPQIGDTYVEPVATAGS